MNTLAEWLTSDHDLAERLEMVDHLCRALDEFHAREPRARPALDPARVEVTSERALTLRAADPRERGSVPEYRAPETVAGAPYEPTADTWSAAVLCYEILAGRHPFVTSTPLGDVELAPDAQPTPLGAACPELPREFADAVMPCLERDPEWRPKDLSYLVEMLHKARQALPEPRRRQPVRPAARPAAAKPAAEQPRVDTLLAARPAPSGASRVPLIALGVVGVSALLGGGLWYLTQPRATTASAGAPSRQPADTSGTKPAGEPDQGAAPAAATTTLTPPDEAAAVAPRATPAAPAATPLPVAGPDASRAAAHESAAAAAPEPPAPRATPTPLPAPLTPVQREATRVALATPVPAARPESVQSEAPAPRAEPAAPARPVVVSAVLPSRLRRGTRPLVDVRGSDLRADLQARILYKGREEAAGVKTLQQRLVNPTLLTIMLEIDSQAREGNYTLALVDALGNVSNTRPFEIGR